MVIHEGEGRRGLRRRVAGRVHAIRLLLLLQVVGALVVAVDRHGGAGITPAALLDAAQQGGGGGRVSRAVSRVVIGQGLFGAVVVQRHGLRRATCALRAHALTATLPCLAQRQLML